MDTFDARTLCEKCNQIDLEALKSAYGYLHQPSFKVLIDSASDCKLCDLILKACTRYLDMIPVGLIAETGDSGPVRLLATGHNDEPSRREWRTLEEYRGRKLSPKIAVTVGKQEMPLSMEPSRSPLLEMYASKGMVAQFRGRLVVFTRRT